MFESTASGLDIITTTSKEPDNKDLDREKLAQEFSQANHDRELEEAPLQVSDPAEGGDPGGAILPTAPDGGWGWVVVGASMVSCCTVGFVITGFSVLYVSLVEYFQCDLATAGWISSMFNFGGNILGVPIGALVQKFGSRPVALCATLIGTLGLCLSYLLLGIPYLCFTFGVMGGISATSVYVSTTVILHRYFDKKRTLATGLGTMGVSIGGLISAPINNFLLKSYGLSGTFLIIGGFWLNNLVCASFYRPLPQPRKVNFVQESELTDKANGSIQFNAEEHHESLYKTDFTEEQRGNGTYEKCETCFDESDHQCDEENYKQTNNTYGTKPSSKSDNRNGCVLLLRDMVNVSVLRNPQLALFLVGTMLYNIGAMGFVGHYLNRLTYAGVDRQTAILCQALLTMGLFVGRIIFTFVGNYAPVDRPTLYGSLSTVSGLVLITFGLVQSTVLFGIYGTMQGFLAGGYFSIQPAVIVDVSGMKAIAKVTGVFHMALALALLISVPLLGFIYDVSGSYNLPYFVVGAFSLSGGLTAMVMAILRRTVWKSAQFT